MKSQANVTTYHPKEIGVLAIKILSLALIYHLTARLGLKMAYVQINTSPVWPPTGIALAALLVFGYSAFPGISLGVLLGSLITGADPIMAIGMTLGNTLEALAGAFLLKRYVQFHINMDRIRDVIGFLAVSMICTTISATIGTISLMIVAKGNWTGFGGLWTTWWIGDLLGALVVAPVLLVWISKPRIQINTGLFAEGFSILVILGIVTWYVFSSKPPEGILHQALVYLLFPIIIWAALRFRQHGATLAILCVSGIAIWGTVQGLGPFSLETKNDSLVLLQTFTAVVSLTGLILAAATIERRNTSLVLKQRAEELATLNDSSRNFLDNFDITSIYQTICRLAAERLGLDVAWIEAAPQGHEISSPIAVHGLSFEAIYSQRRIWDDFCSDFQETQHIKTLESIPRSKQRETIYASYAIFPLVFSNELIGSLKLLSKHIDFFSTDKQLLIQSYANLAAVAIQNALLFEEARMANRQLHALSQRLIKAQEDERLHLSRELHDESGQLLAALTVKLGLLEHDASISRVLHKRIAQLRHTTNAIQENLHALAINLRPASLDHLGLVLALEQFTREFSRQYNIKVEYEVVGLLEKRIPNEIETAVFRIVQESLTNVILHAQATSVDVLITLTEESVSVVVEDNGIGFSPTTTLSEKQLGLFGMRERIEMLGGILSIESESGKGTTIRAEAPIYD